VDFPADSTLTPGNPRATYVTCNVCGEEVGVTGLEKMIHLVERHPLVLVERMAPQISSMAYNAGAALADCFKVKKE
jgi:hypothetical protein